MNIFLLLLSMIFMVGYYVISSPSQNIAQQDAEYAMKKADLRSIAECVVSAQNAAMYGEQFIDECVERYGITSQYVCMNNRYNIVSCDSETGADFNFIITTSFELPDDEYNNMLEILEQYYPDAGTLGIFLNPDLMSAGSVARRTIPKKVIDAAQLKNGQMIYLMQYKIPEQTIDYPIIEGAGIECPIGTMKTYRFGRWQCIAYNYKVSCTGDMIWDSGLMECVADETRKPLCANNQTAVMIDDIWECVDPFADKTCAEGMIARLNYNDLVWECVEDPNKVKTVKKCDNLPRVNVGGGGAVGPTLRVRSISCTDCEKPVLNEDTCEVYCIPDVSRLDDPKCYDGDIAECSGPTRAIYFGFAQNSKIDGIDLLENQTVYLDRNHSQNRMFNCMDCGETEIDSSQSIFPYTAICK